MVESLSGTLIIGKHLQYSVPPTLLNKDTLVASEPLREAIFLYYKLPKFSSLQVLELIHQFGHERGSDIRLVHLAAVIESIDCCVLYLLQHWCKKLPHGFTDIEVTIVLEWIIAFELTSIQGIGCLGQVISDIAQVISPRIDIVSIDRLRNHILSSHVAKCPANSKYIVNDLLGSCPINLLGCRHYGIDSFHLMPCLEEVESMVLTGSVLCTQKPSIDSLFSEQRMLAYSELGSNTLHCL